MLKDLLKPQSRFKFRSVKLFIPKMWKHKRQESPKTGQHKFSIVFSNWPFQEALCKIKMKDLHLLYITKVIHSLNTQNSTKIKPGVKTSKNIPTARNIRRRNSLNSLIFNLLKDQKTDELTTWELGFRMDDKRVSMVWYVEDTALIAETEDNSKRQLYRFHQISWKVNMSIFVEKPKCITLN